MAMTMKNNDETILEILQGHKTTKWPSAKLVKIFIASTKSDFAEERRYLLEFLGPELQAIFDEHNIEIELVDMHYGANDKDLCDAFLFEDHLKEIKSCHKLSRGCFFMSLIGDLYEPFLVPTILEDSKFSALLSTAKEQGLDCSLLEEWYNKDSDSGDYSLKNYRHVPEDEWKLIATNIINLMHETYMHLTDDGMKKRLHPHLRSILDQQFNYALGLAPGTAHHILTVVRKWDKSKEAQDFYKSHFEYNQAAREFACERLKEFHVNIKQQLPGENNISFTVPWLDGGMSDSNRQHETYLDNLKDTLCDKLTTMITRSLEEEPELKSRKKIVEENFQENVTHLSLCYAKIAKDFTGVEVLETIKQMMQSSNKTRHTPILVYGNSGAGKTSLIQTVYQMMDSWFTNRTLRIVRFASETPRSSYNLELLRVICQQISIVLKLPQGFLPKDASFDPLYINNWFLDLLRLFEDLNQVLLICIDDLHLINPLDADMVSTLSWLPNFLPKNVHMICTTGIKLDSMRLTATQRDKFRKSNTYMELPDAESFGGSVEKLFEDMEVQFGSRTFGKLAGLLSCTEYGLTETEILEVLMPTSTPDTFVYPDETIFNFSSLCVFRSRLEPLIKDKVMSGKHLIKWSHPHIKETAIRRYLPTQEDIKICHNDLANLFFNQFGKDNNEAGASLAPLLSEKRATPFQSAMRRDVTYRQRHVEESWLHLLKAGDIIKLKSLCMCNYDFLLAALQTYSVSYLRCVLEHTRCYLLDREIELIYHSIKKSTDVLTRDTYQLSTQLIAWLRPVIDSGGVGLMNALVTSAMAWCDGFSLPLVVPLTDWLLPPLPPHSRTIVVPNVRLIETTPSGQHVICVVDSEPQLWHIMTNTLVHTFTGHTGKVNCMTVTKQSQYLITGSDDISIIVWNLKQLNMKLRIWEHIAPVLCITTGLNNSVIISGGDDSSIIVTSLKDGELVMKIDYHRGPVTSVNVATTDDILISGSQDSRVCLWSLESFSLLNTIHMQAPILMLDVSLDSVFLLAYCKDNKMYLRTVATGTEVHCLAECRPKVKSICMTYDSSRAVVGSSEGKVYIYDIHTGESTKHLCGQNGEITCVRVTEKDDFLLTAGGSRVCFYPFRSDDNIKNLVKLKKKPNNSLQPHTDNISCLDVSRDGQLTVSGGLDNLVNIWQLNNQELLLTLNGHTGPITAVNFAPSGLFVASGSEDKTVRIWGPTMGTVVSTFTGHQAPVTKVCVMMDSTRVLSSDKNQNLYVWLADNGNQLHAFSGPTELIAVTTNMRYALATNGDTALKIWSVVKDDEKYMITHSEPITCFVLTIDSQRVITGSKDMSLKVWQVIGGKLSQVLIGHTDAVTCVAMCVSDKNLVISGSCDNNLIVWDIHTGTDVHTLTGHLGNVTCVKLSGDGTIAISGSEDKTIIIWDTKRGLPLTSLQLHYTIIGVEPTSDFSRISVLLKDIQYSPIICLHNTPAKYVKLPTYYAPDKDFIENPKPAPKRQMKRLLKKEVSLDTYTWQKKYAHLTSNLVIPAVDEKFKRRFSVSASMEEISKIQNAEGQSGMGAKTGSMAQSQHFDQLEAIWNKRSPPRRRLQQSLSKQSSLAESQHNSSDEEGRSGDGYK